MGEWSGGQEDAGGMYILMMAILMDSIVMKMPWCSVVGSLVKKGSVSRGR